MDNKLEQELRKLLLNSIKIGGNNHTSPKTGSQLTDFYVYEWIIRDTGEIFYIGKGRGNRSTERHYNNSNAEKIREMYDIDVKIIADNLTEEEALSLETQEIIRVKKETQYILTNISMPYGIDGAREKSKTTPEWSFETAPIIYTSDVEEHYFGIKPRQYDKITLELLQNVHFITRMVIPKINELIYDNQYEKYYNETVELLKKQKRKIYASKYAKTISSWIYCGAPSVELYFDDQAKAVERIGRNIPVFHLIDVWKYLKYEEMNIKK